MTEKKSIELRLLGEMEIHGPADAVGPRLARQSKRFALLAYLALSPGLHRRECLLALLWPESDSRASRRALRQSLHWLRTTLDREVFRSRGPDEIGVDESALWCDATALEAAYGAGDHEVVAELYRGELLPGFHADDATPEFEMELDDARRRIRRKGLQSLRLLAERAERAGDLETGERYARRALEMDPYDENALQILLDVLDRRGDRAAAVRTYERFAERLHREFGMEPSVECRAAIHAVRNDQELAPVAVEATLSDTLPSPLTSFVGRQREIDLALDLLADPGVRILTLVGPGGMGKTRAAVEIARRARERYRHGVVYASVDTYDDVDAACAALARATGELYDEREARSVLRNRLRDRNALLVLDGLDRVPDLGVAVAEILSDTPAVDVLTTSRVPIRHTAEHRLPIPPLTLPRPGRYMGLDLSLDSEAVALFVDRARAINPRFELSVANVGAVIDLCRRLDGLPLAIELAASRVGHLSVDEIAARIEADAGFLHSDARDRPDRHETLEATIRWTSDRLSDDERALFHGLGAFAGDFDLEVLEDVWPRVSDSDRPVVDLLGALIDRGLVHPVETEGGSRYGLLRTIREHAAREFEADPRRPMWERGLTAWYLKWTCAGFSHWCSPREREWLAALDRERLNLEAVLERTIEHDPAQAAEIVASIYHWWTVRGLRSEGKRQIGRILASNGALEPALRARLLVSLGQIASVESDVDAAIEPLREAESIYRDLGDEGRLGWALQSLGNVLLCCSRFDEALEALEEGLAIGEATGNELRVDACRHDISVIAHHRGDLERARRLAEESLGHARGRGSTQREARSLLSLARIDLADGEVALAERRAREALSLADQGGHTHNTAYASWVLADILRAAGRSSAEVLRLYARAIDLYRQAGNEDGVCVVLLALVETALARGNEAIALRILAGVASFVERQDRRDPLLLPRLERTVRRVSERMGGEALERERATLHGVPLERLLEWAGEIVPAVEIRRAVP